MNSYKYWTLAHDRTEISAGSGRWDGVRPVGSLNELVIVSDSIWGKGNSMEEQVLLLHALIVVRLEIEIYRNRSTSGSISHA